MRVPIRHHTNKSGVDIILMRHAISVTVVWGASKCADDDDGECAEVTLLRESDIRMTKAMGRRKDHQRHTRRRNNQTPWNTNHSLRAHMYPPLHSARVCVIVVCPYTVSLCVCVVPSFPCWVVVSGVGGGQFFCLGFRSASLRSYRSPIGSHQPERIVSDSDWPPPGRHCRSQRFAQRRNRGKHEGDEKMRRNR